MANSVLHNDQPAKTVETSVREGAASERIWTLANIITLVRLLLVPFAFYFLVGPGYDVLAFILFSAAGFTDFLDGQIARRTNTVTEFGKAVDPLVDRLLLACGVVGLFIVGRLPLWMLLFLLSRDFFLLSGLFIVGRNRMPEIRVRFVGKAATSALLVGFAGLILNVHILNGLGWTHSSALPGFSAQPYSFWMWFVYLGIVFSFVTMIAYVVDGVHFVKQTREEVDAR